VEKCSRSGDQHLDHDDHSCCMRARSLLRSVPLVLLVTVIASCSLSPSPVSADELLGTWQGAGSARLTLVKGGSFSGQNMPFQLLDPGYVPGPFTGAGTWSLVPAADYQPQHVELSYRSAERPLEVERSGHQVILYLWKGDPDEDKKFVFTKSKTGAQ
jgi:hypothetical protein